MEIKGSIALLSDDEMDATGHIFTNPLPVALIDPVILCHVMDRREGMLFERETADDDSLTHADRAQINADRQRLVRDRMVIEAMCEQLIERTSAQLDAFTAAIPRQ